MSEGREKDLIETYREREREREGFLCVVCSVCGECCVVSALL